ncbi:Gfo/Idh/MocA family protein [Oceanobacillus chungangensis]|uniref:Gfo/Idh/MocA family oxidoreductase n=1 Tax=Oceanobacillus chungangensis TaxID=1229152 RepID=A0A3D8PZG8_9BACI|nr:Gfo/Idh/MocA family oxidoreductase [Oceanobacillus chungangensis]RDW20728.1 gfo/Idh/MocA family oxidoreductase [Oceanobacillus chungangensis]
MIQVALLSRWHVHADDYAREAKNNEQISIQLVWDEDHERGEKWADELGVPFEANLQSVLSNPNIDAVIVATPTNLHKEIIIEAAKQKKHIFTEKVLAFSLEDCKEIISTVEAYKVELMVSLPRLTDNNYLYAEKSIKDGWLGDLTMIRCRTAHNGAVVSKENPSGWLPERFFNKQQSGGGALIDLGAHPIYLTNRLAGPVQAIYARLQSQTSVDVDDSSAVMVEYESGALGIIETSFLSHGSQFQLELYGTEGTLLINKDQIQLKSIHVADNQWVTLEEQLPTVPMPMEQWANAINTGVKSFITKEDIVNLTLINEVAALSHEEGRRIEVKEIVGELS